MAKFTLALAFASLLSAASAGRFASQKYVTEDFEAPNMKIYRSGNTAPGYLFFGTIETNHSLPYIMTDRNELIWAGPPSAPHNFKAQTLNGNPVITYFTGAQDPFGHGYGKVYIADNTYEVINTICLESGGDNVFVTPDPSHFPGNRKKPCYLDYHESYITGRGSVLLTAFNVTRYDLRHWGGPKDGWIFDWLFYDIDIASQKILFRWRALDHIDPRHSNYVNPKDGTLKFSGRHYGHKRSQPWDFFHGNSVAPVPGGYLINSRMTWSMYKIDGDTGHVKWTLEGSNGGDFKLKHPVPFFSWQHMPRMVTNGGSHKKFQIHLFNNDNIVAGIAPKVNTSSGYLLDVDTDKMHVSVARHLINNNPPILSEAQGSYQALANDHVLLGYGAKPYIEEYNAKNELIYRAKFASTHGREAHSYRAYKQGWHGKPKAKPKAVAKGGYIYASWNGATDYDGWNFYAGSAADSMTIVARNVPKKGFETKHRMPHHSRHFDFVLAEATNGRHAVRNSTVHKVKR